MQYPQLEVFKADISRYEEYESILEDAVNGCDNIVSVSGSSRISSWTDFLPWRLWSWDVRRWCKDRSHPIYGNYLFQKRLISLGEKYGVKRFVRVTGLSLGLSAWNPFSILFNLLLSLTSRYHYLCERALSDSQIPYLVLRPGGLSDEKRDPSLASIQVDASGRLPVRPDYIPFS